MRIHHRLVLLIHQQIVGVAIRQHTMFLHKRNHRLIKVGKVSVAQKAIVTQRPLTACIGVRVAITLTREVNPLGMTELITHKVKVCVTTRRDSKQAYHLMQSHTTIHHGTFKGTIHTLIHQAIQQTERYGLIAHQRLIVRLGISNGLDRWQA